MKMLEVLGVFGMSKMLGAFAVHPPLSDETHEFNTPRRTPAAPSLARYMTPGGSGNAGGNRVPHLLQMVSASVAMAPHCLQTLSRDRDWAAFMRSTLPHLLHIVHP